ncbi:MAG: hypothetical protein ABJF50_22855 [Paracoccaceae bacterium]
MPRAVFIINSISYSHVRNIALFIHETIKAHIDPDASMFICEEIDDADYDEGSIVFLIGETFSPYKRRPNCTYVYLNFSVVSLLGNPLLTGRAARSSIRRKYQMLHNKLPLVDVLLDYYPPQTKRLQHQINVPVVGFDVAAKPAETILPMERRAYDVCFVGQMNTRREKVCDQIKALGFSLSPSTDVVIEDELARSRICLNVHAVRSYHLEIPRFVAALATATPIVTERSFGVHDVIDSDLFLESRCARLSTEVEQLLSRPDRLEEMGDRAGRWYKNSYLTKAENNWRRICGDIVALAVRSSVSRQKPIRSAPIERHQTSEAHQEFS